MSNETENRCSVTDNIHASTSLALESEKVNGLGRKRPSRSAVKLWLAAGGLLGAGMLPCPECGTPMIFHVWPLIGFVLIARAIRKRAQGKEVNPEPFSEDKNSK